MLENEQTKIRRGLVLEGGGAKDAWQFGALMALQDRGIDFNCVSGTSVGALNGAIWCAGALGRKDDVDGFDSGDERPISGEDLWTSMNRSTAFSLRIFWLPIFAIGLVCRFFYGYVKGYLPPSEVPKYMLIGL